MSWIGCTIVGPRPTPRIWHSSCTFPESVNPTSKLILFGGFAEPLNSKRPEEENKEKFLEQNIRASLPVPEPYRRDDFSQLIPGKHPSKLEKGKQSTSFNGIVINNKFKRKSLSPSSSERELIAPANSFNNIAERDGSTSSSSSSLPSTVLHLSQNSPPLSSNPSSSSSISSHNHLPNHFPSFSPPLAPENTWKNDTWVFENNSLKWHEIETVGEIPSVRGQHSLTSVPNEHSVYLFGGFDGVNYFNDIYSLDVQIMRWSKLIVGGTIPKERAGHSMSLMTGVLGNFLVLFGGKNAETYFNDVFFLDLRTLNWTKAFTVGDTPTPRAFHSLNQSMEKNLYVFGGECSKGDSKGGETFNDLYMLNSGEILFLLENIGQLSVNTESSLSLRWVNIPLEGPNTPPPRFYHSSCSLGIYLVIFGGATRKKYSAAAGDHSSLPINTAASDAAIVPADTHLYVFDTETNKWKCRILRSLISGRGPPICFQSSSTLLYGSKLFIFGGTKTEVTGRGTQVISQSFSEDLFILYHLEKAVSKEEADSKSPPGGTQIGLFSNRNKKKSVINPKPNPKPTPQVSSPFNFQRKLHVNFDYQWSGQDPIEVFEIQDFLGVGAYGSVCKATHRETGFPLAIKEVAVKYETEDLKREIEILKKCKHANVVSYFGTCKFGADKIWILMDYCQLGSVRDLFEASDETLMEEEIAYVCSQTLAGLHYLHKMKIIHRDVKAANILLTEDAQVKIADFGVSDAIGKANDSIGTPLWMAPEVIQGAHYDNHCDLWSLGITAIEMADGVPPYANKKIKQAMMRIPINPPPTVNDPSNFSKGFLDFVSSCLVKDPQLRPNAAELLSHNFIAKSRGAEVLKDRIRNTIQIIQEKRRKAKERLKGKVFHSVPSDEESESSTSSTPSNATPASIRDRTKRQVSQNQSFQSFHSPPRDRNSDDEENSYSTLVVNEDEENYETMKRSYLMKKRGSIASDGEGESVYGTMLMNQGMFPSSRTSKTMRRTASSEVNDAAAMMKRVERYLEIQYQNSLESPSSSPRNERRRTFPRNASNSIFGAPPTPRSAFDSMNSMNSIDKAPSSNFIPELLQEKLAKLSNRDAKPNSRGSESRDSTTQPAAMENAVIDWLVLDRTVRDIVTESTQKLSDQITALRRDVRHLMRDRGLIHSSSSSLSSPTRTNSLNGMNENIEPPSLPSTVAPTETPERDSSASSFDEKKEKPEKGNEEKGNNEQPTPTENPPASEDPKSADNLRCFVANAIQSATEETLLRLAQFLKEEQKQK